MPWALCAALITARIEGSPSASRTLWRAVMRSSGHLWRLVPSLTRRLGLRHRVSRSVHLPTSSNCEGKNLARSFEEGSSVPRMVKNHEEDEAIQAILIATVLCRNVRCW